MLHTVGPLGIHAPDVEVGVDGLFQFRNFIGGKHNSLPVTGETRKAFNDLFGIGQLFQLDTIC